MPFFLDSNIRLNMMDQTDRRRWRRDCKTSSFNETDHLFELLFVLLLVLWTNAHYSAGSKAQEDSEFGTQTCRKMSKKSIFRQFGGQTFDTNHLSRTVRQRLCQTIDTGWTKTSWKRQFNEWKRRIWLVSWAKFVFCCDRTSGFMLSNIQMFDGILLKSTVCITVFGSVLFWIDRKSHDSVKNKAVSKTRPFGMEMVFSLTSLRADWVRQHCNVGHSSSSRTDAQTNSSSNSRFSKFLEFLVQCLMSRWLHSVLNFSGWLEMLENMCLTLEKPPTDSSSSPRSPVESWNADWKPNSAFAEMTAHRVHHLLLHLWHAAVLEHVCACRPVISAHVLGDSAKGNVVANLRQHRQNLCTVNTP